jgi:hypothetical protein
LERFIDCLRCEQAACRGEENPLTGHGFDNLSRVANEQDSFGVGAPRREIDGKGRAHFVKELSAANELP